MVQFNLLPDVKLEFIKTERTKRMVVSIAVLSSIVALGIFVLLLGIVHGVQAKNLSDLNSDIAADTKKLQNTENLDKILTIQSQMTSLNTLHDAKPIDSRLLTYIGQVTPSQASISSVSVDHTLNTMTIAGTAPNLDIVNVFVDTLKFTTFTSDKNSDPTNAFTSVVLAGFSRGDDDATFNVTLSFDPAIFLATDKVELNVPNTITTRSVTEQASGLFEVTGGAQ